MWAKRCGLGLAGHLELHVGDLLNHVLHKLHKRKMRQQMAAGPEPSTALCGLHRDCDGVPADLVLARILRHHLLGSFVEANLGKRDSDRRHASPTSGSERQ